VAEFDHKRWWIITSLSVLTIFLAIPFKRTTYVMFGSWGLLASSCYWAFDAWHRSWAFPFVVSLVGVAFIALAMLVFARGDLWRARLRHRPV